MHANFQEIEFENIMVVPVNVASSGMNFGEWPCQLIVRIYLCLDGGFYFVEKFGDN
jgi:hypothetical protein